MGAQEMSDTWTPICSAHSYMLGSPIAQRHAPEHIVVDYEVATKLERDRALMFQWLTAHYAIEEGPGKTDRPQYEELRRILDRVRAL